MGRLGIFMIGSLQLSQQWLKVKIGQNLSFFGLSKSKAFTRQKITSKFFFKVAYVCSQVRRQ